MFSPQLQMGFNHNTDSYFKSDLSFDQLLPPSLSKLSKKYWTPLEVGIKAAHFLASGSADPHLLDVGAGVGKFCATAGYYTDAKITGIEHRKNLVESGKQIIINLGLRQVNLKWENVTQTSFEPFTGIYFFNSFFEQIDKNSEPIDRIIEQSPALYRYYTDSLYKKLHQMPVHTRLATYYTILSSIPDNYTLLESHLTGQLKFWIKHA